jgi:hypothetical protein
MTIRSKIAQAAAIALVLGAGFTANAQTTQNVSASPDKLFLVTVDSTGCADVNASDGPIASFSRNCGEYQAAMPREMWIPSIRSQVIDKLCPKVDGGRQCIDAVVVRKGKPDAKLTEQLLRRTSDTQAVFLARQLRLRIPM